MDLDQIRADLDAEQASLDDLIASEPDAAWATPTSSPGWTVGDQIGHLGYFDRIAAVAIVEPDRFESLKAEFWERVADGPTALDDHTLDGYRSLSGPDLREAWRADRAALRDAAATLAEGDRVEWFGPSMGARSFLTARLMEAWAHGQDVVDALALTRPATDRLESIARLGFITRGWSYANRGDEPPATAVRVSLAAPSGTTWDFGEPDAPESIQGPAEDFCLVVTQRRHPDDTDLYIEGASAREWMLIAQAFAGLSTDGPAAGERTR